MLLSFGRAWKSWKSAKGAAILAILAFAAGIGSATAIFTVVNTLLFQPLPYPDGERWITLLGGSLKDPESRSSVGVPDLLTYEQARSFDAFGWFGLTNLNLTAPGEPRHLKVVRVTPRLVNSLGVSPQLGRWFANATDREVVLSHSLWQRLGADTAIIGKPVTLSRESFTVAGVMPQRFRLPMAGPYGDPATDLWLPLDPQDKRNQYAMFGMARIRADATILQAQAEVAHIASLIAKADPAGREDYTARLDLLRDLFTQDIRKSLYLMMGAAILLLLLTCANVAGLMLARSVNRARETAVCVALGARASQLARQYFQEGLLISSIGAILGVLLSVFLVRNVLGLASSYVPHAGDFELDWRVALFAVTAAFLASALASLAPLWQALRTAPNEVLNEGVRSSAGARSRGLTRGLVIAEIALAMTLLSLSAVILADLRRLLNIHPGLDPNNVLTFHLTAPESEMAETGRRQQFQDRMIRALETIPGVSDAGFVNQLPLAGCCYVTSIHVVSPNGGAVQPPAKTSFVVASPGYLRALRIPLRRGRELTALDVKQQPIPVMVNEAALAHYWPGQEPIGANGRFGDAKGAPFQIVGVVGNVRNDGLQNGTAAEVYLPYPLTAVNPMQFVVRANLPPAQLIQEVRRAIRNADPAQPIHEVRTMHDIVLESLIMQRITGFLVTFFAGCALLLASLGVYGVVSYSVRQQTVELGTRMSLGAEPRDLLKLVVGSGLRMAAYGLLIGVAAATAAIWGLTQAMDVREVTAVPLLLAALVITTITGLASFLPAWRASTLSPMVAIRNESESMWTSAQHRLRKIASEIRGAADGEEPRSVVSESDLLSEFVDATRGAESFHNAMNSGLDVIRARTGAQWVMLIENKGGAFLQSSYCTDPSRPKLVLPANGVLTSRLRSLHQPLPLSAADYASWTRWASESKPQHLPELQALRDAEIAQALALRTRKETLGLLVTGGAQTGTAFQTDERHLLASAAPQLALMIENGRLTDRIVEQEKLRRDLELASEVQRRLLPERPPTSTAAEFAAMSLPARSVGGDYYDFLPVGDHQLGIALADVAGKGVSAALVMSVVQSSLRMITSDGEASLPQLAARMNRVLKRSGTGSYATFFYAQLDEANQTLRYVNAGHNPPYLVRAMPADGAPREIEELKTGGMVIGLFPQAGYEEGSVQLRKGDVLVAFTDGVTEAMSPSEEEFGEERLQALLREIAPLPVAEIATRIAGEMRAWIRDAAQFDDLTFLVMKVS
ncbi:MAG: SpoIIE family protein phosphatase [Bryobacterales bacterium]|nr:SpoIIE family protein phosphatase [Bryobacterales bacterium]